ncbi:MAG: sigma 54-interacting transcriptional regulator [Candidatus Zixiibacteriota bacterium]
MLPMIVTVAAYCRMISATMAIATTTVRKEIKMSRAFNADIEYRLSCQKYLEDLMTRRDFQSASRYYDTISDTCSKAQDLTSGIIVRLGAKAFGLSGNLSKALVLIRTAINIISKNVGETENLAECYLILGDILRDSGKFTEAEKAFRDAESIYRRNDSYSGAGDALNRLAGILFRKGDFDGALSNLLEAVEYARKEMSNNKLAYLFGNIGRVYMQLGRLNKACDNISMNIDLSKELGDELELARAYLSLGYLNIQRGEYDTAEVNLADALDLIKKNKLEREETIYLTYSGELLLKMNQYDGADWMLNQAVSRSYKIAPESLLAARPLRQLAELYIKRKSYRKALQFANKSMVIMKKLNDRIEIGALTKIQAVCHEHLDEATKALRLFTVAIAKLEECRAKFELADALAEAGRSSLYNNRQRTVFLCRAEEMYSYCGVDSRALQIQKIIGTLKIDGVVSETSDIITNNESSDFVTANPKMKKIAAQLKMLSHSDIPILLTGETGTGKDFMARYFHNVARSGKPYVAVNCAAVPDTLIESELFGYRKGAFTGADSNQKGLFLAANGGVLLLDEIGELPLFLQAKLLSILETRKLRPLGSSDEYDLDIILLAATNRDLKEMVEEGTFRRDLYYRLAGFTFELPPLRERKEDIPNLLEQFMRQFGLLKNGEKPESELVAMFVNYDWPGNIRQMENKIKQLSVMASMAKDGSILEISRTFFDHRTTEKIGSLFEQVEQFEIQLLKDALLSASGNKSEAARILDIHESTFRAKMKKYGL